MARFKIISKDGKSIRYEGKPRYVGTYLKPSFLEFNEIASPTPIAWEVGDYVDYSRTGMRYYLYSIPQASKNATKNSHGKAFTYSGVQLHAATKELEIAPFRDIVASDNNIHFSTSPDVTTFEDIYGIALRIQECMNDLYPDRWEIRVADFDDADIIEKVTTKKDFALSGGTCLDALSKIYELWQDIGWIHTYDKDLGKEVITIGYANALRGDNVSEKFFYGKGNGLTAIKKNQINKEEFATRLYVYGSERNLPPRYYGQADFPNAESADIRNLMLPLDVWGLTNGSPDPRKAYLQNDEAVAKYGVIPKTHYFDSDDAGANIYPTIKRLTIGEIRDVISSDNPYYPSSLYSDTERADIILGASNPSDDGVSNREGKRYEDTKAISIQISSPTIVIPEGSTKEISRKDVLFNVLFEHEGMGEVSVSPNMNILVQGIGIDGIIAEFELSDDITKQQELLETKKVEAIQISESTWSVSMPKMSLKYNQREYESFRAYMVMRLIVTPVSSSERTLTIIPPTTPLQVNFSRILPNTFNIKLKQIGFNIEERASQGKGKTISMKSGMCEGRGFVISSCIYDDSDDSWNLICRRQKDETLGVLFPNVDYPVQSGDEFILLDIAMPDSYIHIAANRLLEEGEKLLSKASKAIYNYEPAIDARVMAESGRKLREGMFMEITDEDIVDNTTEYILIDTLNINEDESAIPAYRITLRERRKVTYKGTPSATSPSSTSSVEEESEDDNSKLLQRLSELEFLKDMFYWHDEAKTIIATNHSLIVKDEMASAGTGADNDGSESVSVINSWNDYNPNITQALGAILGVELHERLTAVEGGISEYATISFVEKAISDLIGGADGAYDTLLEIQQILQGNEASIGTILEEIGKKASKEDLAALELRVKAIEDAESEDMFAWADEEHTTIETEKNLVVKGDFSDAGVAGDVNIGVTSIVVDGVPYPDSDRDGVIDLTGAFENINVNLDNYYTKTEVYNKQETYSKNEVDNLVKGGESDMFAWADEAKTTIKTEKNLIVEGELSDSGVAGNVTVGISTIRIDSKDYTDTDRDGIIDLTDALKAFDFNLEDYATKAEVSVISTKVNSLVAWKEDFSKYIYIDEDDGLVHVTTDIIIGGDIATAADGEGGGSYASIGIIVGNSLAEYPNAAGIVTLSKELIRDGIGLGELAFTDNVSWDDVVGRPTSLSQFTDDVVSGKYLPLTGGTLTKGNSNPLIIKRTGSGGPGIEFYADDTRLGSLGIGTNYAPFFYNANKGSSYTLLYTGNVGDYALKYQGISLPDNIKSGFGYNSEPNGYPHTGGFATFGNGIYGFQIMGYAGGAKLSARGLNSGTWTDWKTIAFTDSNVASANALTEEVLTDLNTATANRLFTMTSGYGSTEGNKPTTAWVSGLTLRLAGNDNYRAQIALGGNRKAYFRDENNGSWRSWKEIAFTDSDITGNAATATKLQYTTAFTAWGQTFFENGQPKNASGDLNIYQSAIYWHNDKTHYCIESVSYTDRFPSLKIAHYGGIAFQTADSTRIHINSLGNMTIGSTDKLGTSTTTKLYVDGGIRFAPRKIWGQSFDGTTDVTGLLYLPNMGVTAFYDTAGNAINVLHFSDANNLHLGYGNRSKGYNTIISGNNVYLYYGSGSQGFILNSSGNVGIGSTSPAYKLDVHGITRSTGEFISTNSEGIGFRTVKEGYGVFFQNRGSNCYLLTTAQNDAYGSYNSLRPFAFNLSTGKVTLGEETTVSKLLTASGGAAIPTGKTLLLGSESLGATLQYIADVGVKIDGNLVVTGDLSDAGVADSGGGVGGYFDIAIYPQYAYGDIYLAEIVLNGSDAYYLYMPSVTEYIGYTPFNEAEFTRDNIKSRLGISDWALAASKPSYTTNDVGEGANLYFTNARAKSAIFTGSSSQFLKADGTLDSTTYLGLDADGDLNIPGSVFANGIEFDQDVYISYLDDTIQMYNRYAGIYLYAGDMITLDGIGVDISSTEADMFISSEGTMDIRCDTDMAIYSYGVMEIGSESDMDVYAVGGLGLHSEGKASITSDMAITITGAHVSVGTQDRTASFLLQDGLMNAYCDLAIQGSLELRHTGNYIGTGASNSMLFHSENNAIIFEVGEDQMVSITEDGLYVTSINDYKFDVETAVISGSSSLVTSGAVYSAIHGNLTPSANNTYNIGEDNKYYKYVIANNFFSGSVSNNLWLICGENSNSTAIVFARASTSTDSKVEMGRIDGYGITIEGDAIIKGDQATGSDIRFKNVIEDKVLDIKRIAEAPLFTFVWNDRNDDSIHLGSSAQYWEGVAPWLVSGEDFKTLNYATLGVAMGISLAKKTVNHEERIKELERKVESLETENRRLRYGN